MPTFDVVTKTDLAEVDNAVNGTMREIANRYDFKGSKSEISRLENEITLIAEDNYKIDQLKQIIKSHFVKRKLDAKSLVFLKIEDAKGGTLRQKVNILQGIDREISQKIVKTVKETKSKVQVSIRGDELRVTGAKKDVLQNVIQLIKNMDINQPLQFINFRD